MSIYGKTESYPQTNINLMESKSKKIAVDGRMTNENRKNGSVCLSVLAIVCLRTKTKARKLPRFQNEPQHQKSSLCIYKRVYDEKEKDHRERIISSLKISNVRRQCVSISITKHVTTKARVFYDTFFTWGRIIHDTVHP